MIRTRTVSIVVRILSAGLLLAATAGLVATAHAARETIPVVINGSRVAVRRGSCVRDLVREYSDARPGDLVAVTDRRVIEAGAGEPVRAVVDDGVAALTDTVESGARLWTVPGADVVEPVVVETRTVEVAPREIGEGPIATVIAEGAAGIEVRTLGAVSHDIVETETIAVPQPGLVRRAPQPGSRVIALTFDDGPWPRQTEEVLGILAEKNVPATFFMLGSRVSRSPEIARLVVDAGHVVGNHTWWHPHLCDVSRERIVREIAGTSKVIEAATGVRPQWFRPPAGSLDDRVTAELQREGMRAALWTIDPRDWCEDATAAEIVAHVTAAARPGSIVVLHDGGGDQSATIAALPALIDTLRAQGYQFVTLEEMASVRASW